MEIVAGTMMTPSHTRHFGNLLFPEFYQERIQNVDLFHYVAVHRAIQVAGSPTNDANIHQDMTSNPNTLSIHCTLTPHQKPCLFAHHEARL